MKRSYISLATYSLLLLVSCTNESEVIQSVKESPKTFYATTESYNPQTKTSLNLSGNVLWKIGDQVSIFNVSTINQQYQVTDQSDGKTSASLYQVTTPGFVAGTDLPTNIAYYPYSASNEIAKNGSNYEITVSLPSTQNYAENSFGNGSFPMAAVTEDGSDMNLKFKNILGGLKLQLTGTDVISRIVVSGNNNEILCGDATVTASNTTTPTIVLSDDTKTSVTLDCGSGVQLNSETPTLFIIALPPMIMTSGFTIDIYNPVGGTQQIKSTRSQTITRSALLAMPAVAVACEPSPYEYVDLGLSVKWATFNVGATAPEESGDYFAWGELEAKSEYYWANYRFYTSGSENSNVYDVKFSKYNTVSDRGTVDNKTTLDAEDDVAHMIWGGNWRMPSEAEFTELMDECTWTRIIQNGVKVTKVTSNKPGYTDRFIILPAAGYMSGTSLIETGKYAYGRYWTSSLETSFDKVYQATDINFDFFESGETGTRAVTASDRNKGLSVRPVCPSNTWINNISVTLNKSELSLSIYDSETLAATIKEGSNTINYFSVTWSSSNPSVATVDEKGVVTAISDGNTTITATFKGKSSSCNVTVNKYVDLGLSVKWAMFNVGANAPEEYGDYFAWGETEPYYESGYSKENPQAHWKQGYSTGYNISNYKYCNGSYSTMTKYCSNGYYGNNGFTDNLKTLLTDDDVAHVKWGGNWRMPTIEEFRELKNNCTWQFITQNGVNGYKVSSLVDPGRSIFLPAAGYRSNTGLYYDSTQGSYDPEGRYWTCSLYEYYQNGAYSFRFFDDVADEWGSEAEDRSYGLSVRPVCP